MKDLRQIKVFLNNTIKWTERFKTNLSLLKYIINYKRTERYKTN